MGRTNAIEILKREHRAIEALFDELENADDGERPIALIGEEVHAAIAAYTELEEARFYPALRSAGASARASVVRALEEHAAIHELLDALADAKVDDDEELLFAIAHRLMLAVRAHLATEEAELFVEAERGLSDDELHRLGLDLAALAHAQRTGDSDFLANAGEAAR